MVKKVKWKEKKLMPQTVPHRKIKTIKVVGKAR